MVCYFARRYITGAVLPNLNPDAPDDEKWGNELRKVCVLFVNLGIKEQQLLAAARYDEAMKDARSVLMEALEVHKGNALCPGQNKVHKHIYVMDLAGVGMSSFSAGVRRVVKNVSKGA